MSRHARLLRKVLRSLMRALPALVLVCAARPLLADVGPDDVVTAANADAVEGLVPPGVEWMVHRGMRITVGKTRAIALPDAYVNATRRYSADVRLRPDGRGLENWTAGQPFPVLDPADPDIARKIMHNFDSRWWESDDVDLRNLDADSGGIGSGSRGMAVEKHFVIDHFKRLYFTGRLTLEPKPAYVPNNDAVRYKESLHPLIEPFDLKGVGFTYYRYLDAARQDDSWLYLPQIRRVRRLSSAQRSDALFGQDTDQDSYGGYAGNIAWMDWRFVGEATVLAPVHGVHFPAQWGPGSSDFTFDDIWEKRRVYVVEGVSKLAQYAYGKRVLFVDKEAFFIPYSDIYDRAGQLWKVWLNNYRFAREPWPDAPDEGRYPSDMPFLPSIVMVDVQRDHVTRASLPSRRFVREVGWRFNKGEQAGTREEFFSVAELLRAGH